MLNKDHVVVALSTDCECAGDTHARATTEKSSQFHGSRRYMNSDRMKPRAMIRVTLSIV